MRTFPIGWNQPVRKPSEEYWDETSSVRLHPWLSRKLFNVSTSLWVLPTLSVTSIQKLQWTQYPLMGGGFPPKRTEKVAHGYLFSLGCKLFPSSNWKWAVLHFSWRRENLCSWSCVACCLGNLGYVLFFLHDTVFGWLLLLKLQFLGICMHLFMQSLLPHVKATFSP